MTPAFYYVFWALLDRTLVKGGSVGLYRNICNFFEVAKFLVARVAVAVFRDALHACAFQERCCIIGTGPGGIRKKGDSPAPPFSIVCTKT